MATIKFQGKPANTSGNLPAVGSKAPAFNLVTTDLTEVTLESFSGKFKVLNIFPSIDTGVCAASVRHFNEDATQLKNTVVLNVSMDLPFAQKRFCGAEGIENAEALSAFRSSFAKDYGLLMSDTALAGLCSRAVVVLNGDNKVIYTEQVDDIVHEPNYEKAIAALKSAT